MDMDKAAFTGCSKRGYMLELWCLTPLLTVVQLYRGGLFYHWIRKPLTYFITQSSIPHHERDSNSQL